VDDLWLRIALIAAALSVAAIVVALRRRTALKAPRRLAVTRLPAGIYLFTSADCDGCRAARAKLNERLGEAAYNEIAWEDSPEVFNGLGVDVVPATMVVADDGSGHLWRGQPDHVALGP
jgi:hypothetical protein